MAEQTSDVQERLGAVAGRIYRTDPDGFIEERDRLARQVREDGDQELSEAIGRLRKPTLAAWAVDQVALRDADDLQELFRLGDVARAAMQGDQRALRGAMGDLRDLVADLRDRAAGYLERVDATPGSHLDDVEFTLRTAAVDPGRRADVAAGALARPLETSGFGALTGLEVGHPGGPAAGDPTGSDGDDGDVESANRRRRELERERRRLTERLGQLRARHEDAQRRVEDLREQAEEARRRVEELQHMGAEAQQAVDQSATELAEVEDRLRDLSDELDAE